MDSGDTAQVHLEHLDRVRDAQRVRYEGRSANECARCGELIPSERQVAVPGCQYCVDCAEFIETKRIA